MIQTSEVMPRWSAIVCVATLLFAGCGDEWETNPALNGSATTPAVTTTGPLEGQESLPATDEPRKVPAGAVRAARAFLRDYLPYGYGKGDGNGWKAATPAERKKLGGQPVRVTPDMRKARPELTGLRVPSTKPPKGQVLLYADVEDGVLPYTLLLTLVKHRGGWAVTEVVGA